MDAPCLPRVFLEEGKEVKIAPVHSDFAAALPLSSMGYAGWLLQRGGALDVLRNDRVVPATV
jgi:hypothetical protein